MGAITDRLQKIQSELLTMQNGYRDTTLKFWALALAWEAVRFAWYVCADDLGAQAKLRDLKLALARVTGFYSRKQ
jgi:hypothetical protein